MQYGLHLWHSPKDLHGCLNALQARWVVQGGQHRRLLDLADGGIRQLHSTVDVQPVNNPGGQK